VSSIPNYRILHQFITPCMNQRFAYVDFATPEAKTAAIAKSELPLIGRRLLIKDGVCIEILYPIDVTYMDDYR
jgi:hypothetical protein